MESGATGGSEDLKDDIFLPFQKLYIDGDDEQKLGVIHALPHLLQCDLHGTLSNILPKIQEELPNASCEFNLHTSQMFRILIEKRLPVDLMQAVYMGVESRDSLISSAWVETLIGVINVLSESQIKNEVLAIANRMASDMDNAEYRQESCRILGNVAVHRCMGPLDVKKEILPLVHGLCQDCNNKVRAAMCINLPLIAKGLGRSLVKSYLLPSLVELSTDEYTNVRAAAIEAVVNIFLHVNEDTMKNTIVPLVRQLCRKSLQLEDTTGIIVTKEIGKLMDGLLYSLTEEEGLWFLQCFKELSQKDINNCIEIIRQNCANNLPSLTRFVLQIIPQELKTWKEIFHDLVEDSSPMVRQTVAENLHEIARILGCDNAIIEEEMILLLKDDSEEVLQMLVPNLGSTLELFFQRWGVPEDTTLRITEALHQCQTKISNGLNWRLLVLFIQQLESLPNCISSEFIYTHFMPEVLKSATQNGPRPVKLQAARTLLIFLRFNTDNEQRKDLRSQIQVKLANSSDCYSRIVYVKLCAIALDVFSEKYFKEYFFKSLLALASDRIANVRLCVVSLFPRLKKMIEMPWDLNQKQQLEAACKWFKLYEVDRDVKEVFEKSESEEITQKRSWDKKKDAEEKRRQDEENWIDVQKEKPATLRSAKINVNKGNTKRKSVVPSSVYANKINSVITKSTLIGQQLKSHDMKFLEQHFYIDAGVNLPPAPHSKLIEKPKITNITDDEKVSLRKKADEVTLRRFIPSLKPSNSTPQRKAKRYSSVFSTTCLEVQTKKNLNRRSLDFSVKDTSRIPISNSGSPKKEKFVMVEKSAPKIVNKKESIETTKIKYEPFVRQGSLKKENKMTVRENGSKKSLSLNKISINNADETLLPLRNNNSKSLSQLPVFVGKSLHELKK